jgi:arylsulfatase A-like enzyme
MKRRTFLGVAGLGAAATAQVNVQIAQRTESPQVRYLAPKQGKNPFRMDPSKPKKNVFLISADMITPDHYHPSRSFHRDMDLPALRQLAADGVTFTNAFCASPLCAPARAALVTGRYTYITANGERAHDGHETILRDSDVIFQEYLRAAGYVTKHAGKGHLGTQKFVDAFGENAEAWDRWAPPVRDDELYLAYLRRLGVKPAKYKREIRGLQQDRKRTGLSLGGWVEQANGKPFPLEAQYSWYLAERAIEKLDAAIAQGGPIYLQVDFFDPHQPFVIPDGFEERERELRSRMTMPASYAVWSGRQSAPATEPKVYDFYRKYWGLYSPETVREYRVAHALQFEFVDKAVGHFLDALRKRGLYEDSVVIFTGDHGEMNGRRGLVDKGVYLHPEVLRVPMIVKPAGRTAVKTVDAPVCHMDVAPTLLSMTGIEPMARMDGIPLQDHLAGKPVPQDRDLLFECGWHVGVNFACATQMRRNDGSHLLYTYNLSSNADELYDLTETDASNLAADQRRQNDKKEMIAKLGGILESDPRWLGYWHSFRIDKNHELPRFEDADPQLQSGRPAPLV